MNQQSPITPLSPAGQQILEIFGEQALVASWGLQQQPPAVIYHGVPRLR